MSLIIFSVYDKKAGSFNTPFFAPTEEVGRRAFIDLCRDERTTVAMHPEDFDLFAMGEFSSTSGGIAATNIRQLMTGMEARMAALKSNKLNAELLEAANDPVKN